MSIESLTHELIRKEQECDGLRRTIERQHDQITDLKHRFGELPAGIWVIDSFADISGPYKTKNDAVDKVYELVSYGIRAFIITAEDPFTEECEVAA